MRLAKDEFDKWFKALNDAFSTRDSLESLAQRARNKTIDQIAVGKNIEVIIGRMIQQAQDEKWLFDLIGAACELRPKDSALQTLHKECQLKSLYDNALGDEGAVVPFVIAAMTQVEAVELLIDDLLVNNTAVAQDSATRFLEFKQILLQDRSMDSVLACYRQKRDFWTPLICPANSIREIISDVLRSAIEHRADLPYVVPDFSLSDKFFSKDDNIHRLSLRRFKTGGILVIDAVSVFHPTVKRRIAGSLSLSAQIAMIVLSPLNPAILPINLLLEKEINYDMQSAVMRFEEFDNLCQTPGVGDLRIFRHRLVNILPQTISHLQKRKANSSRLNLLRKMQTKEPSGLGPAEFLTTRS